MLRYMLTITFVLFSFVTSTSLLSLAPEEIKLIYNMQNLKELPRNFRTAKSPYTENSLGEIGYYPSRQGLDELHVSGSAQFSRGGLEAIIEEIGKKEILIVDLRQESHGFINNHAASWRAPRDWGNVGMTPEEIEQDQLERLLQLKKNGKATIFANKDETTPEEIQVEKINTEQRLAEKYKLKYKRFYVTDHVRPTDQVVDEFVALVKNLPKNVWIHFHCAAGKGRTTTFMAMYDIMHNAQHLSFEDIILRQWLIGGLKLDKEFPSEDWRVEYSEERIDFLRQFYHYVKSCPNFKKKWSELR